MVYLDPKTRSSAWSVTLFFDTPKTPNKETREYQIDTARQKGWIVEGQVERCPHTGNLHFQLLVKTSQIRARAIMDTFPQAEIQVARNDKALQNYVHKEETREEELKKDVRLPLTWPVVRSKFYEWLCNTQDVMVYATPTPDAKLELWDTFIGNSFEEGVEIDLMGVNPQYRSCILKYWDNGIRRQLKTDRQTSIDKLRQTDTQECSLPVLV